MISTIIEDTISSQSYFFHFIQNWKTFYSACQPLLTIIKQQADSVEVRHYIRSVNSSWKIYLEY